MFSEDDYKAAAAALGCDINMVKAFASVESSGLTHWKEATPAWAPAAFPQFHWAELAVPILFEGQWFSHLTRGQYDEAHPGISYPEWDRTKYLGGIAEYDRLHEAAMLDPQAALMSASWGAFQVMGFNEESLGYPSVYDFVAAMQTDAGQMDGFVKYIIAHKLVGAMRTGDYVTLAAAYNGPGQVADYSQRMRAAYAKFSSGMVYPHHLAQGDQGADVLRLQQLLHVEADGFFGPRTKVAVMAFQAEHDLEVDGIVGPKTWKEVGL